MVLLATTNACVGVWVVICVGAGVASGGICVGIEAVPISMAVDVTSGIASQPGGYGVDVRLWDMVDGVGGV